MSTASIHHPNHNSNSIIDIGANLTNSRFDSDLPLVLERAKIAGITHIIVTGTSIEDTEKAIKLSEQYPEIIKATSGIHPHDAKNCNKQSLCDLEALAKHPSVRAIGETGLDFNRNFSTPEQQVTAFEQQIEIAITSKLPLFLHERDAHKKQREILSYYRDQITNAVIHCFTGSKKECFNYLDLDLYIGITGWICDERRGLHLQEFISDIPGNRLMIETDAPYLTPRVKPKPALLSKSRNEPCTLTYVLETIAQCTGRDIEALADETSSNAKYFFNL